MQTDMSPIDDSYDPAPPPPRPARQYFQDEQDQGYFQQPSQQPQQFFQMPPQYQQPEKKEGSFFAQFDKITWIVIALLVLIAFFMGKTMQPIILKA